MPLEWNLLMIEAGTPEGHAVISGRGVEKRQESSPDGFSMIPRERPSPN
jgi:hypothetical protein